MNRCSDCGQVIPDHGEHDCPDEVWCDKCGEPLRKKNAVRGRGILNKMLYFHPTCQGVVA